MLCEAKYKVCGIFAQKVTVMWLFVSVSVLFFARSYSSYFVSDDYEFLGRINLKTAARYFTRSWGYGNEYRPLAAYSYALDGAWSGLSPIGYHFTNTILHTSTALLVGATAVECGFPYFVSWLAGTLFLLNPVTHQSVLWIAGRPVVLSTFFVAIGIWAFVKATKLPCRSAHLLSLSYLALIAALLTYEGATVFPMLALLLEVACLRTRSRQSIQSIAAFFIIVLAYATAWGMFFSIQDHSLSG
jgi:dolichyl-phosphate-mannose--protein O-mannosyl transferase